MSNVGSSHTYVAPKGETTEWDDIQRRLGNLPPLPADDEKESESEPEDTEPADPYAGHTIGELDEAEDDEHADDRFMEAYRRKRVEELKAKQAKEKFGRLFDLTRPDFIREVSEGSNECWVVVLLHQDYIDDSVHLGRLLTTLAAKHPAVKFMKIKAEQCIEGYPDKNVPTLVIYKDNDCKHRLAGLGVFGGRKCNADWVEWVLADAGVLETELEEDPRKDPTSVTRLTGRADSDDDLSDY